MKICLVGNAQAVHLNRLARSLAANDCDVTVLTHHPVDIPGVTVEKFAVPELSMKYPHRYENRFQKYLADVMKSFDIVNLHFLHDWGFTPEIIEHGNFVVSPWGSDIINPPGENLPGDELISIRKNLLQQSDLVTTCGKSFAGITAEYASIDVEDIAILPFGVDLKQFAPRDDKNVQNDQRNNKFKIGFYKGFRPVYGATYLVRALPTVLEEFPSLRLHMIGDGPEKEMCQQLAGHLNVDFSITWVDRQPHANIPNYLDMWDLTIIPSVCESFGVAALESSAVGVPVIASDVHGLPDTVIHSKTGRLVPPQSPEQLADEILNLLCDPITRWEMSKAGQEFVRKHFDWNKNIHDWIGAYKKVREEKLVMV